MTRFVRISTLILASISLSTAAPTASGRTQYAPSVIPVAWKRIGTAETSGSLSFTLVFEPVGASDLDERMTQIALSRGEWLSQDEVASYFVPSAAAKSAVKTALEAIDATDLTYSSVGDKLTVTTTVEKAAEVRWLICAPQPLYESTPKHVYLPQFFTAEFLEYSHPKVSGSVVKTHQYTIPSSIVEFVSDVYPFATFGDFEHHSHVSSFKPEERTAVDKRATPSDCDITSVTSSCVRSLYGFDSYQPTTSTGVARLGMYVCVFGCDSGLALMLLSTVWRT